MDIETTIMTQSFGGKTSITTVKTRVTEDGKTSIQSIKTYSLEDGKYEIDRDADTSFILAVRRNGEDWPVMFEQIQSQKFIHAMLNRIDELEYF